MILKGYYINKEKKITGKFKKTLKQWDKRLIPLYGSDFSETIQNEAMTHYRELIPRIPYYDLSSYQNIILINSQLFAIIKALKNHDMTMEEVLKIEVDIFSESFNKVPQFVGKIFVSKLGRYFLNKTAVQATREGWDTELLQGSPNDDFDVSVVTTNCAVVSYMKSEGMDDLVKYCNFGDFKMFPSLNIGLSQAHTIDSGKCVYCMKYNGESKIPESLNAIYT